MSYTINRKQVEFSVVLEVNDNADLDATEKSVEYALYRKGFRICGNVLYTRVLDVTDHEPVKQIGFTSLPPGRAR